MLRGGTISDATIIEAPHFYEQSGRETGLEIHQTNISGRQWHYGMKIHTGIGSAGYIHNVTGIAANVHDVTETTKLLREDDEVEHTL